MSPLAKSTPVFFHMPFAETTLKFFLLCFRKPKNYYCSFIFLSLPPLSSLLTGSLSAYLMVGLYKVIKNKLAVGDWWKVARNLYTETCLGLPLVTKSCDPALGSPTPRCHSMWTESQFLNPWFHSFAVSLKTLCSKKGSQIKTVLLLQWITWLRRWTISLIMFSGWVIKGKLYFRVDVEDQYFIEFPQGQWTERPADTLMGVTLSWEVHVLEMGLKFNQYSERLSSHICKNKQTNHTTILKNAWRAQREHPTSSCSEAAWEKLVLGF